MTKGYKQSQAALEFIMTYGWAILVVLVAVGALAYFGVLSPDRFLPSKCTLQSGIACLDHSASSTTNELNVVMQNSLGFDITISKIEANLCTALTPAQGVPNSGTYTATLTGCNFGTSTKYNGQFNITYATPADVGGLTHKNVGQITTRIQ